MNFKKISVASIGLAALLFSCGGKKELKREEMQDEITKNYNEKEILDKYSAGKKVKVVETLEKETEDKTYTLDGEIYTADDGTHFIKLEETKGAEDYSSMPILDSTTLSKLPESVKFYKINNGYSMSAAEGSIDGDVTFGKDFVCTSMKATVDGKTMTTTFTLLS